MQQKTKRNPRKKIARQGLLILIIAIVGATMLNLSHAPSQLRTVQLSVPQPQIHIHPNWHTLSNADERFVDSAFSLDGTQLYALTNQQLRVYNIIDGQLSLQDSLTFDSTLTAGSLAIHPNGEQIAIGAAETVDDPPSTRGTLLTIDISSLSITTQLTSDAGYNLGYSLSIRYTPDGDHLYHLFNLNNAGCGRTFERLERWHLASETFEAIQLPYSHIGAIAITDRFIAATVHASCITMPGSDTKLVIRTPHSDDQIFATPDTVGYRNLQLSHDQLIMLANVDTIQPPYASTVHVWEAQDLSEALEIDQIIRSMAISPDNRIIAFSIMRDMPPSSTMLVPPDVEIHIYDRVSRRITQSLQTALEDPIAQIDYSPDGSSILLRTQNQIAVLPLN